jgi:hypothetical protein
MVPAKILLYENSNVPAIALRGEMTDVMSV